MVKKNKKNRILPEIYSGQDCGLLEILEPTGERNRRGEVMWRCKCACGNTVEVNSYGLKTERVKSCGCLKKKIFKPKEPVVKIDTISFMYNNIECRAFFDDDGITWFVAYDICECFKVRQNIRFYLSMLGDFEKKRVKLGVGKGNPPTWVIRESGVYELLAGIRNRKYRDLKLSGRKKLQKDILNFKKWFCEFLTALHKQI